MSQLYHPAIHDEARPVASWWAASAGAEVEGCHPLEGEHACDVAVIGGGYTGLSAALHLARDFGIEARVLEAGPPGWGASGRNGGICCVGSAKLSYIAMLRRFGPEETRRFYDAERAAVALVKELAASEGIAIDAKGEGEISVAHKPSRMEGLARQQEFLLETFGQGTELWSREELAERAYRGPEAFGALYMPVGFGLHPLKYARGLARAALKHGATIHAGSRVLSWRREGGAHRLATARGTLRARRVVVATNGFTREGLDPSLDGRLLPALSNIIVTRPLTPAERDAQGWRTETPLYDTRNLLFYFRLLPDGRFLFGGRGGASASPAAEKGMREGLARRLGAMFPAWREIEVSHFWRGLVCLAPDLLPHLGTLPDDPTSFYALAYHGNGIAMGTWCGRALARLLAGERGTEASRIPAVIAQPLGRFPFPRLRLFYLRAAYLAYRLEDEWL